MLSSEFEESNVPGYDAMLHAGSALVLSRGLKPSESQDEADRFEDFSTRISVEDRWREDRRRQDRIDLSEMDLSEDALCCWFPHSTAGKS